MPHPTVKAIFWDNDGVLVDTEGVYFEANRRVFESLGLELTLERFLETSLVQGRSVFESLLETGRGRDEIDGLRRRRNRLHGELLAERGETLVIPGVRSCVQRLAGDYFMAIVTSCLREHFEIIHQRADLLPFFRFVVMNGDYSRSKPHPDPYLKALNMSGFRPDECLVVEDSERGLRAAVAAGLRCVAVRHELSESADLSAATRVVSDLRELEDLLADPDAF